MMYISIIVPNYNGIEYVDTFFQALLALDSSGIKYEVIFVDNGSTDGSLERLRFLVSGFQNGKVLLYTVRQSSYAARNYGAQNSQGEVLVFTDIDCIPSMSWLRNIRDLTGRLSGEYILSGGVELFASGVRYNVFEWYDKCAFLNQCDYAKDQTGATANLIISRAIFIELDGFLEIFSGGDRELCRRAMKQGVVAFYYCPEVLVLHPARDCYAQVAKKLRRLGYGRAKLLYNDLYFVRNVKRLAIEICGMLLLLHQWRIIIRTFKRKDMSQLFCWCFLPHALFFGLYQRAHCVARLFALLSKRRTVRND